ncbi:MAG: ABC transporter ATP-binding protein [Phycisphaeraceae bacterium]|nr:ABC transporter ATP-binding protein [Phycisphaeraceae bacterium]
MIELNDITFAYEAGGFTLNAGALSIAQGEKVAVVGPSGSGKTTLLHLIAGILVPTRGKVSLDGQVVSSLSDKARRRLRLSRMGLVFQGIELVDYLSAKENVLLPYRLNRGISLDDKAKQRAEQLLQRVGLSEVAGRAVSGLSQGERQRVGICRALIAEPGLILADEPTASLDEASSASAVDLLIQLVEDSGSTLVMLTHDKVLLPRFDRVVMVDRGAVSGGVS